MIRVMQVNFFSRAPGENAEIFYNSVEIHFDMELGSEGPMVPEAKQTAHIEL